MIKLIDFVLGNGYRRKFNETNTSDEYIDNIISDIKKNFKGFDMPYTDIVYEDTRIATLIWYINESVITTELIRIGSFLERLTAISNYNISNYKETVFDISKTSDKFQSDFGIFVKIRIDYGEGCSDTIHIMKIIPYSVSISHIDNKLIMKCVACSSQSWTGGMEFMKVSWSTIDSAIYSILRDDMNLSETDIDKSNCIPNRPGSMGLMNHGVITYMQKGLKHDLDKLSSVIQDIVSMRNCDYSSCVVIDSLPGLGVLSGSRIMSILDQLPKIKRLERNDAFTTAVWEDNSVTRLKKSEEDEDNFENLVFFLILKKLCDNNTHKMHSTLTDYLNTFRDATVDIPKQKEEKAEKKRKAKEEVEEEERKKENDNGNVS